MDSSSFVATKTQEKLAALLALIAGYIDAYGFINYRTYLSFMSGNTTQTGYKIGEGNFIEALPSFIAIIFFLVGIIVGNLLIHSSLYRPRRLLLRLIAALQTLIVGVMALGFSLSVWHIAVLSLSMGLMNTTLRQIGAQSLSLTFVTGTLNNIGRNLALGMQEAPIQNKQGSWDTHWRRAALLAGIWSAFFIGALFQESSHLYAALGHCYLPSFSYSSWLNLVTILIRPRFLSERKTYMDLLSNKKIFLVGE